MIEATCRPSQPLSSKTMQNQSLTKKQYQIRNVFRHKLIRTREYRLPPESMKLFVDRGTDVPRKLITPTNTRKDNYVQLL
mmetsp:Transcript_26120/g.68735  ORF Transcript_26120/g.68735 Transcript_26120/m.68735 type:complete len:80 (+) Transcript_26120:476-715(+)